jgi:hypothetical protein
VVRQDDLDRVRRRLQPGWLTAARAFATGMRSAGHAPGRLLVVGPPDDEPWHLTAHLAEAAQWRHVPELAPTLLRWHVPAGAPAHLAVPIDEVTRAGQETTVLVTAPGEAGEQLLERLDDARRGGAALFALHGGDAELAGLVRQELTVPTTADVLTFDTASHLVTEAATGQDVPSRRFWGRRFSTR